MRSRPRAATSQPSAHQIEELDDVVAQARSGRINPREATAHIEAIRSLPPATQLLGHVLATVGLALLLGSSWIGLAVSAGLGALAGPWLAVALFGVGIVMNQCARLRSLGWILIVLYVAYGAQSRQLSCRGQSAHSAGHSEAARAAVACALRPRQRST
jgi:hypothetical protein